jgi:hypothetical protein
MERTVLQVEEIQREMQKVRANLGTEVRGLAQRARQATDWRYYVRRHPWVCLGAVAATGYLLVPQKKQPVANGLEHVTKNGDGMRAPADSSGGISATLASVAVRALAGALVRGGLDLLRRRQNGEAGASADPTKRPAVNDLGRKQDVSTDDRP